ncbi:MAG TPA: hypothetical protein VGV12_00755 [Gemmatimonadales bacterium]|nr:hypothetical protein [Gemmatimonadales bacterium]
MDQKKKKTRRGRPLLPAGDRKSCLLRFVLTRAELQRLRAAAAAQGTTVPRYARRTLTAAALATLREFAERVQHAEPVSLKGGASDAAIPRV